MTIHHSTAARRRLCLAGATATLLAGCAGWSSGLPLKVSVVDVTALPGAGIELRFMVTLRVQNASDRDIAYDGVSLELDLRGLSFASGVGANSGSVPRFGEVLLSVPVSVSATALLRQALLLARSSNSPALRITYAARGRLAGGLLGGQHFESAGEIEWPPGPARSPALAPAPLPASASSSP